MHPTTNLLSLQTQTCIRWSPVMIVLLATLAGVIVAPVKANTYYNDFESYSVPTLMNGVDGWITDAAMSANAGRDPGWYVADWDYFGPPGGTSDGQFLLRSHHFSTEGSDWATLHFHADDPFLTLGVSMNYLLQGNEAGRIELSGDGASWVDITGILGITPIFSNSVTFQAGADLTAHIAAAGISQDVYLRFNAWNPTSAAEWHWFAIDNILVTDDLSKLPPPKVPDYDLPVVALFSIGFLLVAMTSRRPRLQRIG